MKVSTATTAGTQAGPLDAFILQAPLNEEINNVYLLARTRFLRHRRVQERG